MDLITLWAWITEHINGGVLLIGGGVLASLIQISPVKLNPWSWLFNLIRRGLGLSELSDVVKNLYARMDKEEALNARRRILRFNDELLQDIKHSREMFDSVLDDVTTYEKYCQSNKDFKNQKATLAIENVNRVYKECMKEHSFL